MFPDEWWWGAGNLVVAVGQPLLLAWVLEASMSGATSGFEPHWLVVAGFVAAALLWMGTIVLHAKMGLNFVACILLVFVGGGVLTVGQAGVMAERGVRTACVVTAVDKHTQTHTTYDSPGGGQSTWTETSYVHALRCEDPKVTGITTGTRLAGAGERLDVDYDPEGRVAPLPADVTDSRETTERWVWWVLAAAVLVRVTAVVWEWYDPF
ncbi:hypothetical protein [Paractinoplanes lichenicola]|uniref:DUF3592 domain-containing protein n=1 Tax=Paractinoplanes lichenicola TaxID=2802976 RepID=A0ABS1VM24_9ACTN|nr:hypothetical protein [Actinoplanes lichenicola]MBL7255776.1 hypothetical protein [Actinoplanes lichenicola]